MRYSLSFDKDLLVFKFAKCKIGLLPVGFDSVVEFVKYDFNKIKDALQAIISPIKNIEYCTELENLENIARIEEGCIKEGCIILYSAGIFSPCAGVEVKMYNKDKSFAMVLEYEHALTVFWWGEFNSELAKLVGEVEVVIGDGTVAAKLIEELNPMAVLVLGNKEEFIKQSGIKEIEEAKTVKLNLKPEDKDIAGLKVYSLIR